MNYSVSTHRRKWILSQEKIDAKRAAANKEGIEHVIALRAGSDLATVDLDPLTVEDEAKMVGFWIQTLSQPKITALCPKKVTATAITFMKRFYLKKSCMEHDAMVVLVACVYISCKVCENYVDAAKLQAAFGKGVKSKEVLALEPVVLEVLEFDLVVYHPYCNIDAMAEELKLAAAAGHDKVLIAAQKQEGWLRNVHKLSYSFADAITRSDAPLLMSPHQQGLCAVAHSLQKYGLTADAVVERYAGLMPKGGAAGEGATGTDEARTHIREIIATGNKMAALGHNACSKEVAVQLDKKLREFNPWMNKQSDVSKSSKVKKRKRDGEPADPKA